MPTEFLGEQGGSSSPPILGEGQGWGLGVKTKKTVIMTQTDNTLRSEAIRLATRALDIISKTLDILAVQDADSTSAPQEKPATPAPRRLSAHKEPAVNVPTEPQPSGHQEVPSKPDSYRADTVRFNEQFLNDHYELRYNTMLKTTEFRPRNAEAAEECGMDAPAVATETPWRPITDRDLNALTVNQLLAGGQSWSYGMRLCVDSSRVDSFDPVADYLDHLPRWDGQHDYIAELAARVPTQYKEWPQLFRRWLLAMVAQARGMNQEHGNSLVPLLIGAQGTGKSTFCKMLLPRHLRQYYMDDIKMDNAEQVERVLGRMWLVNIDEYDSKTPREQAKIKRLLTERDVQVRRPRSDQYVLTQRLCSFIATTNDDRPLNDPTGSRRYLCVELSGPIDTTTPIDHDQLFAQVLHELEHGERFFLTREEEAAMEVHNEQYCRQRVLEKAVSAVLEPAPTSRDTLMTATDIMDLLADHGLRPQDQPSPRQLATVLRTIGLRRGAQQGKHGWYARKVSETRED